MDSIAITIVYASIVRIIPHFEKELCDMVSRQVKFKGQ